MQIWQLLIPEMGISKLSGNTVKIITNYLPKAFDIWHFSLQNWLNWHTIRILSLISFNLTPRSLNLVKFEVWSFIKRFTTASPKFTKIKYVLVLYSCPIRRKWIENKTITTNISWNNFKINLFFILDLKHIFRILKILLRIWNVHYNIFCFKDEIFQKDFDKMPQIF